MENCLRTDCTGASLYVKPQVLPNDLVKIDVYPRTTAREGEHLSVDVKEVSTRVVALGGQTMLIGGLNQSTRQVYRGLFGTDNVFNGNALTISLMPSMGRP